MIKYISAVTAAIASWTCLAAPAVKPTDIAADVISRFAGKDAAVELKLTDEKGPEAYATKIANGKLVVTANSPVALCHGFYAATKAQGRGMNGWAGNRFAPGKWTSAAEVKGTTPFDYRYYFNVVTYGYSTPYWTWDRWCEEIDYMALHGINAPIALVAQEAIMARVFKKLGLTDDEIQKYFVGPAHLPWMRMGNISGLDAPMPLEWHKDQIALQHKILDRIRALGMKPITPGFAGFVPPALKRIYPDLELIETKWCGGRFHNWMVMPNHPVFEKIGTMFLQEYEKEFGKNDLILVDSFNEMETPFPPKGSAERYNLMNEYGEKVYRSLKNANPDAIWVMQGWMFGYQRGVWDYETLAALMKKVPDDKMFLLDEACDYNRHFWRNGWNWDRHKGYSNKLWGYGVIPNMGGKCGMTGVLDFYANGHLEALGSSNRGRLVGYGQAPEGIECNPVVFEILSDAAWRTEKVEIRDVLKDYSVARYGKYDANLEAFWDGMLKSCYGSFVDHASYNWQNGPGRAGKGSINANDAYFAGLEAFTKAAPALGKEPLYRADLVDYAAMYVGGVVEKLIVASEKAMREGETELSDTYEAEIEKLMLAMDRLLESHPHLSMQRWIDFARAHGNGDKKIADYYEKNARRIVTIWGPPVDDYACKIWSGLIRDYYVPRRKIYIDNKRGRGNVNRGQWERAWVEEKKGLSSVKPAADPVKTAVKLVQYAKKVAAGIGQNIANGAKVVGSWSPDTVSLDWNEIKIPCATADIRSGKMIRLKYLRGNQRLEIKEIAIELDGRKVAKTTKPGFAGTPSENNFLAYAITDPSAGNNSCNILLTVRTQHNTDSSGAVEIVPR